jgi:hypothetical protein
MFPSSVFLILAFLRLCVHINVRATKAQMGALTDGKTWMFYYIVDDRFFQTTLVVDTEENAELVLGTCSNFATL